MKAGLRKISCKMVVKNEFDKDIILKNKDIVLMNQYNDVEIKHDEFMANYTFEFLQESAIQFVQGIWSVMKGFAGMMGWSVILIWEGFRLLWKKTGGN